MNGRPAGAVKMDSKPNRPHEKSALTFQIRVTNIPIGVVWIVPQSTYPHEDHPFTKDHT